MLQACDHHTGQNCTNPPVGASFYPWYHLASVPGFRGRCAWALSNDMPGQLDNFGGEQAAWGPLELTDYGFDLRYQIADDPERGRQPGLVRSDRRDEPVRLPRVPRRLRRQPRHALG